MRTYEKYESGEISQIEALSSEIAGRAVSRGESLIFCGNWFLEGKKF